MNKLLLASVLGSLCRLAGQDLTGIWEAELTVEDRLVPFRMQFERQDGNLRVAVLDGEQRLWSSSAKFEAGRLAVRWDFYDANLEAEFAAGRLRGVYRRQGRGGKIERGFTAQPWRSHAATGEAAPNIAGAWRIEVESQSRSRVMKGLFRQSGNEVSGTVQRIDGDFGTLEGRWSGNLLRLSHFDLIRATLIEIRMIAPGKLEGVLDGRQKFTAIPLSEAQAAGLQAPPDPSRYTGVKNPAEAFRFAFKDLDGKTVSLEDPRFRGKAVIVSLTGTWCPNCHDEAPFLKTLHQRWGAKGLEIVSVFFEYTGEPERDHEQIRIFMRRHGIDWTVLYAGIIEDGAVERAFPQLSGFGAFPTTIFLARDHRVASVHAGFAGPANREEHEALKKELEDLTLRLVENR
ncbi:MAG: TlpA family protein disulfide reductase [Bryobacteraceae bacterium]|nr:TlpA family protein disulfide reductase [Bryobacteraceae bacterium]